MDVVSEPASIAVPVPPRAPNGPPISTGPPPDDTHSGGVAVPLLGPQPAGSRATPALGVQVGGRPFHGMLKDLAGAQTTPSPVVYDSNGMPGPPQQGTQAFIVDFGVAVSVLSLEVEGPAAVSITLVLPWLGTDFSPNAAYPASAAQPPVPRPDPQGGSSSVGLTGVETPKLLVQLAGSTIPSDQFPQRCRISTGTYPSNVRASLNGRLPFWTKPGPLRDQQTLTGLVEDLNALLDALTAPAPIILSMTTDTPGVLTVTPSLPDGAVVHSAAARWGGQASTQVALGALASRTVEIPFPTDSPAPWAVTDLTLELSGAFPAWRAYPGQPSTEPGDLGMRVDAQLSVARRIQLAGADEVHGLAIPVRPPAVGAHVHVELQAEQAGLPSGGKPVAAAEVAFPAPPGAPPGAASEPIWQEVVFASPVRVEVDAGLWFVVKAKTGAVEWAGAPESGSPEAATLLAAGGGPWQEYPRVAGGSPVAQVRILRRPRPAERTPLLDVAWDVPPGGASGTDLLGATTPVDLGAPASPSIPIAPTGGVASLAVSVTARASGTLTFRRAEATYREASG